MLDLFFGKETDGEAIEHENIKKMYPELFRIGSFPINTYGVFLAIAFLCAIYVTVKLASATDSRANALRSQPCGCCWRR